MRRLTILPGICLFVALAAAAAPEVDRPASSGEAAALDETFARILQLEDRRSVGGAELAGYLDASRPPAVRARAALAFGRIGAPVATPYDLVGALRDPEPQLRRLAAFALGEMDDPKAAPLLAGALLDTDAGVRAAAAEALGKLKDPVSVPALMAGLKDPDADVKGMALLALWKIEAGPLLAAQAEAASAIYAAAAGDLRRSAAYFLMRAQMGHAEDDRFEGALGEMARDPDALIRSFAARGLGAVKSAQATQTLIDLADDDDWRVRVNAFNGLKSRRVEAEGFAKKRWRTYKRGLSDKNAGVALSALAALETCGAQEAAQRLKEAVTDVRPRFREVALLALAAREKSDALAVLRPLAADAVWSVRARTAEALSAVGGEPAAELLARLAADADPRVRSVAVEGAGRAKIAKAGELLATALQDEDMIVRAAAMDALAAAEPGLLESGDKLISTLAGGYRRALGDPQNDARLSALAALAKVGTEAARAEIEKAFDDSDYLVRRRAAELMRDTFHLNRFSRVGEPRVWRTDADYLEAVARARRRARAVFETDAGRIEVELLAADAPLTVDNFIRLARDGLFDGLSFHRVVPNFVIQDGDPRGDGNGGAGGLGQIRCEINMRRYGAGAVGMALSGKDTGASQYFITHSPQPHLDGGYTIFGQVVSGQEFVEGMQQGDHVRRITIIETPGPS